MNTSVYLEQNYRERKRISLCIKKYQSYFGQTTARRRTRLSPSAIKLKCGNPKCTQYCFSSLRLSSWWSNDQMTKLRIWF